MREFCREQTRPFLLLLDDYYLTRADEPRLIEAAQLIEHGDCDMVRVAACPGPTLAYPVEGFGEIDKREPYSLSLQAAMWQPKALADIIRPEWSAWDVEIHGSERAATSPFLFLGTHKYVIEYLNAVRRGAIQPEAERYANAVSLHA